MKNIILTFFLLVGSGYLVVAIVASFTSWNAIYFNPGSWPEGGRYAFAWAAIFVGGGASPLLSEKLFVQKQEIENGS